MSQKFLGTTRDELARTATLGGTPLAELGGTRPVTVRDLVDVRSLESVDVEVWRRVLANAPGLARPMFTPEYVGAWADASNDACVARLECDAEIVGFLPLRRTGPRRAASVAGRLDDFAGPVLDPRHDFDPRRAFVGSGIDRWGVRHRLVRTAAEAARASDLEVTRFVDLSSGFEAWFEDRKAAGRGWTKQVPRKRRNLERESGELDLALHDPTAEALELVREWKSDQRRRTSTIDPLDEPMTWRTVQSLARLDTEALRGCVSVLRSGGRIVAVHLGLRTATRLHIWFPAFDRALDRTSPGMILMLDLFRRASEDGIERVDFGPGDERYKESLHSGIEIVTRDVHDARPILGRASRVVEIAMARMRRSPVADRIRGPKRRVQRWWSERRS